MESKDLEKKIEYWVEIAKLEVNETKRENIFRDHIKPLAKQYYDQTGERYTCVR